MNRSSVFITAALLVLVFSTFLHAGHEEMTVPFNMKTLGFEMTMPLPSGGDLRHHIIGHDPYKKWKTWPGKDHIYEGSEPHGSLLITYVNDIAFRSIINKKGIENNSIIVKENYTSDRVLTSVTVMYKVKGYNPKAGDWVWVKYDPDFEVLKEGKLKGCILCHENAEDNDYIFTGEVK